MIYTLESVKTIDRNISRYEETKVYTGGATRLYRICY